MRLPVCGGYWSNGAEAGVFAVNLSNPRSNAHWNIGFRCALPDVRCRALTGARTAQGEKDSVSAPKGEKATGDT